MDCIKRLIEKYIDALGFNKVEFIGPLIVYAVLILWTILVSLILSFFEKYELKWAKYSFFVLVFGSLMIFCRKFVLWCIAIIVGGLAWVAVTAFVYININEYVGLVLGVIPYCYTAWKIFFGKLVKDAIESFKMLRKSMML